MSTSHSKVSRGSWTRSVFLVETGLLSGHSVPRDWTSSWIGNSGWPYSEAIFASSISKFGKFFPEADREDFNFSNEPSISTSLIHNMASDGKSEQVVTWILNRVLQTKNDWGLWNLSNCSSEIWCPFCPTIQDDSQSSRLCIYSGEASIFRSSPSSRSESAMLSAES